MQKMIMRDDWFDFTLRVNDFAKEGWYVVDQPTFLELSSGKVLCCVVIEKEEKHGWPGQKKMRSGS